MNDDEYPSKWVSQAPPPDWDHDPAKTAAIDARLCELILLHLKGDNGWVRATMSFAGDVTEHDEVPELLSAVCRLVWSISVGSVGHQVAVARFTSDLRELRIAAIEESMS